MFVRVRATKKILGTLPDLIKGSAGYGNKNKNKMPRMQKKTRVY